MKYIRTKTGVYELANERTTTNFQVVDLLHNRAFFKSDILAQADTIEELCDGFYIDFVNYKGFDKDEIGEADTFDDFKETFIGIREFEGIQFTHCEGYGFIKTSKGLIYVAKMNEKGELELI